MFDVTFANGACIRIEGEATIHDLSRHIIENGRVLHMQRVREPRAFAVARCFGWDVVTA